MFIVLREMFLTGEVATLVNALEAWVYQCVPQLSVLWSVQMDLKKTKMDVTCVSVMKYMNVLLLYAECIVNMVSVLTKTDVRYANVKIHPSVLLLLVEWNVDMVLKGTEKGVKSVLVNKILDVLQ